LNGEVTGRGQERRPTVTNFYTLPVYDRSDNKIGDVDDVLIGKEGRVTAMIIGVRRFLGIGEKDVGVPFSSVRASEKNNRWLLPLRPIFVKAV
jgi:sporulation protein YlmC with PRC-barrel domain